MHFDKNYFYVTTLLIGFKEAQGLQLALLTSSLKDALGRSSLDEYSHHWKFGWNGSPSAQQFTLG